MPKELKETISRVLKKSMRISHQIENINKEVEISFWSYMENLDLKSKITEWRIH